MVPVFWSAEVEGSRIEEHNFKKLFNRKDNLSPWRSLKCYLNENNLRIDKLAISHKGILYFLPNSPLKRYSQEKKIVVDDILGSRETTEYLVIKSYFNNRVIRMEAQTKPKTTQPKLMMDSLNG